MRKLQLYFLLLIISVLIISCHQRSNQDILTGGNYKYWVPKHSTNWFKSTGITYFDKTGKYLYFIKYANGRFEKDDGGDIKLPAFWNMPKNNLFNWGGTNYKIVKLTDSIFVIQGTEVDTLFPAPDSLIPADFRKLQ